MPSEMPSVQPFLVRYATPRSGNAALPGRFDHQLDVWVLDGPEGPHPIVRSSRNFGDTSTLTRVRAEQDDTDIDAGLLASTTTFTKVAVEGDDTDVSCAGLLEVTTKTQAQVESEDVAFTIEALGESPEERASPVRRIQ